MNIASERTKQWMRDNPEKHKINVTKKKENKAKYQKEAIQCLKTAVYKTPMGAIKGFCREICMIGTSRCGAKYFNAHVSCKHKQCPLFCFRNGNPVLIKRGLKKDMAKLRASRGE